MSVDVYFGACINGGNSNLNNCRLIVDVLSKYVNVLTKHVVLDDVQSFEREYKETNPWDNIFLRDRRWLDSSKFLVGDYSIPSTGLGWETNYIQNQKKPILALHSKNSTISNLIALNDYSLLDIHKYVDNDINNIDSIVSSFLLKHKLIGEVNNER